MITPLMTPVAVGISATQIFNNADTDRSGGVSLSEYQKMEGSLASTDPSSPTLANDFQQLDSNHDGQLTSQEMNRTLGRPPQASLDTQTAAAIHAFQEQSATQDGTTTQVDAMLKSLISAYTATS